MLEFENDQVPVKAEVKLNEGFVMLPIGSYNALLLAANSLPRVMVKVEPYAKYPRIDAYVDHEWLYNEAIKALHEKFSDEALAAYDIRSVDHVYIGSMTIAEATAETKAAIDAAKVKADEPVEPEAL